MSVLLQTLRPLPSFIPHLHLSSGSSHHEFPDLSPPCISIPGNGYLVIAFALVLVALVVLLALGLLPPFVKVAVARVVVPESCVSAIVSKLVRDSVNANYAE